MISGQDMHDAGSAIALANRYLAAKNYRRAEEVLRSALLHNPHNSDLLIELARAQHLRGDNDVAERTARDVLSVAPEDAYPMRIYASILVDLEREQEAVSWARRAVDAAPLDHATHYEYARILLAAGRAAEALPVATETLRMAPDDADTHDLMGVVLGMLGRRAESTAEHEAALRLQPGHARALANIAVNRANSRNLSGALAGFREAGRLDPHIGAEIRSNITATVRMWLGCTILAAWVALYLLVRIQEHADRASLGARIVAGVGVVVVVAMFGWLIRHLPRNLWAPVLRQPEFRSLKIYLGVSILVLGVLGAFALGAPLNIWVLVATLLTTVIASWVAPRFDRH